MNLGNAEIGITLDLEIFNQFFRELYSLGVFPNYQDLGNQSIPGLGTKYLTVLLDQPDFELIHTEPDDPYTRLHITGTIEIKPEDEPEGTILLSSPLDAYVKLTFVLLEAEDDVPTIGLQYDGIDGTPTPSQVEESLHEFMSGDTITSLLENVNIDAFDPMVSSLEGLYFPDGDQPDRSEWPVQLFLYKGSDGFVDSLAGFIARPGESPDPAINSSFLPELMGLAMIFNRNMLDTNLAIGAQKKEGTSIDGAKITRLSLEMDDDGILVDGHAEKEGADVDFNGPIKVFLSRGTTDIQVDTSEVDVDVDMPWYYYLGRAVAGILFFVPVVGWLINAFWLVPLLDEGEDAADAAPGTVRKNLGDSLDEQLDSLSEGLQFNNSLQSVTIDSTPDHLDISDGNITLYAQVFVSQITENLTNAFYSNKERRFIEYDLESGRRFRYSELARLVQSGKIIIPDYHDVNGNFIRSNHDTALSNNLEELYEDNLGELGQ